MSKSSGGTRVIRPTSGTKSYNRNVFEYETAMEDVDEKKSYFSEKTGAYSLVMKGHILTKEEREVAEILADNGYISVWTPEGGKLFVAKISGRKGTPKYLDGYISGVTFDQKTPNPERMTKDDLDKSVVKALEHAVLKDGDVALIYDRYGVFHRENIADGIARFETLNTKRLKAIVVINSKKEIYEWYHDT